VDDVEHEQQDDHRDRHADHPQQQTLAHLISPWKDKAA
jgi:hypothetical protein